MVAAPEGGIVITLHSVLTVLVAITVLVGESPLASVLRAGAFVGSRRWRATS